MGMSNLYGWEDIKTFAKNSNNSSLQSSFWPQLLNLVWEVNLLSM